MYSKVNQAEKGIEYSCKTMQRQLETNTHQVKDFCLNCIHLADYFNAQHKFEQSLYLLQCAMALLPADQNKRKKLRATVQISIGALYLELLTASNDKEALPNLNFKVCTFPLPQVEWPSLKQVSSDSDAVHTFKLANTQL